MNKDTIEKENDDRNKNNVRKKKDNGYKRKENGKSRTDNTSSFEKLKTAFVLRNSRLKKFNGCLLSKRWFINTLLMFNYL